jgi:hypothetical protein
MILFHGTSEKAGKQIMEHGFGSGKANWKVVGKPGFIYLSLAYAPFYAMASHASSGALIKVEVDEEDLYPEDDFIMTVLFKKPVYNQAELDKVDLEKFKHLAKDSLRFMGNACAKFDKVKILGVKFFDMRGLLIVCDPSITPINYAILGRYYNKLTNAIFNGDDFTKMRIMDSDIRESMDKFKGETT